MSLRDTLRATVARCTSVEMQHATLGEGTATDAATTLQQNPAIPHGIRVHAATALATAMQQGLETRATESDVAEKLQVALPNACNTQPGVLTAHRIAAALIEAAMRRCDEFGDGDAAREEMRQQCLALTPRLQVDLLEHFQCNIRCIEFDKRSGNGILDRKG
jgi:hypothetical protein